MEPCRTSLVTSCQSDVTPFTITLHVQPASQLLTHHVMCLSGCGLDIWRMLWKTVSKILLRSKKITSTSFLWSTRWVSLFYKKDKFDEQNFHLMNLCWWWLVTMLPFRCFSVTPRIILFIWLWYFQVMTIMTWHNLISLSCSGLENTIWNLNKSLW